MSSEISLADRKRIDIKACNSNYFKSLGIKVKELHESSCVLTLMLREEHKNSAGTAHGGVISALADTACGVALLMALKKNAAIATQNLNVYFIHPASICELTAKGRLIKLGRKTSVLEADVFDDKGEHIAHAHSVLIIKKSKIENEFGEK